MQQIVMLPISKVHNAEIGKIRPLHTELPQYQNLKKTIATVGYNGAYPILVRPMIDPITKAVIPGEYLIVNGQHRHHIMTELGAKEIPAVINDKMTDEEAAICMYQLNESVPTKLSEKHEHFKSFCARNPGMTQEDVAEIHGISPQELGKILKFDRLNDQAKALVEQGKIPTTKALALATVPTEFQEQFLERAVTDDTKTFVQTIQDHKKEIAVAKRKGAATVEEKVVPKLVSLAEAKIILEKALRELKAASPDNVEEYAKLTGRKDMCEEMMQVDPHTLAYKEAVKEQEKTEKALAAARKKRMEQDKAIKELEAKKAKQDSEEAEVEELSIA